MRWLGEPVRGRWVAVTPCDGCGRYLVDTRYMREWYRQEWGKVNSGAPRPASGWFSRPVLCKACNRALEAERRRQVREKYIRNCVVCGDPFHLWKKRTASKCNDLVCSRRACKRQAEAAFDQAPFRGIEPRKLREAARISIVLGDDGIHYPQVLYAICALLKLGRSAHA